MSMKIIPTSVMLVIFAFGLSSKAMAHRDKDRDKDRDYDRRYQQKFQEQDEVANLRGTVTELHGVYKKIYAARGKWKGNDRIREEVAQVGELLNRIQEELSYRYVPVAHVRSETRYLQNLIEQIRFDISQGGRRR